MAEIPVEKKSSMSWLWWLLLLAGIIALLWWAFAGDDDVEEDVVVADVAEENYEADTMSNDEVTAITGLAGLAGLGEMIGREVELSDVAVNEVVSDEGFTVGEGDNETLVMFDEERTPNDDMEGNVDVNPGSNVTIRGTVREFDANSVADSAVKEVADSTQAMIFATSVEVID